jgi:hypothetical protein
MADKMSIDSKPQVPAGGIAGNQHPQHPQHQQHQQHHREDSEESMGSTPDQERQNAQSAAGGNAVSQDQQQPKRKGGRKPVSCSANHVSFSAIES